MQLVRVHGPGDVRLDEVDATHHGSTRCRSCASPRAACAAATSSTSPSAGSPGPGPEPMPLGHELAGTVTAVGVRGRRVSRWATASWCTPVTTSSGRIGQRRPRRRARRRRCWCARPPAATGSVPVPDTLDLEVAALAEPLAVGMNAADRAQVGPDDSVVIFGAGPDRPRRPGDVRRPGKRDE